MIHSQAIKFLYMCVRCLSVKSFQKYAAKTAFLPTCEGSCCGVAHKSYYNKRNAHFRSSGYTASILNGTP